MVEIPSQGVIEDDGADDHLWRHGLDSAHAVEVWYGPAKYFSQDEQVRLDEFGRPWRQPARTVMIGPDFGGRLLTFILAAPNERGISRVITGWIADGEDRSRYNQPGGRMRQG